VSQQPAYPVFCFEGQKITYPVSSFLPDIKQYWTWSGFRIAIQPDSAIRTGSGSDWILKKTQPDQIWISKLHWSL